MQVKGVTFMAERIWRDSREFAGVFIHEEQESGKATTVTARRGSLSTAPEGDQSVLLLQDGVRLESAPPAAGSDMARGGSGVLTFSQTQMPLDLAAGEGFRPRGEDERELTLWELWQQRATPPEGVRPSEMVAEFHDRVVRSLSVLFLPFLAVPFALGGRRTPQSLGIAAGLFILVGYNELLSFGKSMVSFQEFSPFVGQWLPLCGLAALSLFLFYRTAYLVPRGGAAWSPLSLAESLLASLRGGRLKRQHSE